MLQEIKKTNKSFTVTIQLNNSNFWIDSVYLEIGAICIFLFSSDSGYVTIVLFIEHKLFKI